MYLKRAQNMLKIKNQENEWESHLLGPKINTQTTQTQTFCLFGPTEYRIFVTFC
jgi:hypothetical protein